MITVLNAVLLTIICSSSTVSSVETLQKSKSCSELIDDLFKAIPITEISALVLKFAKKDANFRKVPQFLDSPSTVTKIAHILHSKPYSEMRQYLLDASNGSVDCNQLFWKILEPFDADIPGVEDEDLGGFGQFFKQMMQLLDVKRINNEALWLFVSYDVFRNFVLKAMSPHCKELFQEVLELKEAKELTLGLEEAGVDFEAVKSAMKKMSDFYNV